MEKQTKCSSCKHYSHLVVVPSGYGECWFCQAGNCVFCTHDGENCNDYEFGENDGGRSDESYLEDDGEEGE